jgi:hypothetical protein
MSGEASAFVCRVSSMWDAVSLLLRTAKTGTAAVARLAGLAPRGCRPTYSAVGQGNHGLLPRRCLAGSLGLQAPSLFYLDVDQQGDDRADDGPDPAGGLDEPAPVMEQKTA